MTNSQDYKPPEQFASGENTIKLYIHCTLCEQIRPKNMSPKSWSRISVGWTEWGLQIWCDRNNTNITHIDFQGQQHPANVATTRKPSS